MIDTVATVIIEAKPIQGFNSFIDSQVLESSDGFNGSVSTGSIFPLWLMSSEPSGRPPLSLSESSSALNPSRSTTYERRILRLSARAATLRNVGSESVFA